MLSLTVNSTFDGLDQSNALPPDPYVSAGPANLLATVNDQLALFDKDGNIQDQIDPDVFFPDVFTENFASPFDPWSVYDPYSQRYFVMYEQVELGTRNDDGSGGTVIGGFGEDVDEAYVLMAISTSDEPDDFSADNWTFLEPIDGTTTFDDTDSWINYPKFATDEDSLYITGNFFSFGSRSYQGVEIIRLDKIDALNDTVTIDARVQGPSGDFDSADETLQPVQSMFKSPGDPQFFVSADDDNNGIDVWELGDDNVLINIGDDLGSPFTKYTGGVPQMGSTDTLDSLSDRLMNAVERNGTVWTAHTVDVDGEATVRWYEIDVFSGFTSFVQQGDIDPGDDIHTFMPAINADVFGNMAIAFNRSGPEEAASFWVTGRQFGQPEGFTYEPIEIDTGAAGYSPQGDGVQRWGDYNGIALDPQDNYTFWVFGEVALDESTWTTKFGQVELPPMYLDEFDYFLPNNSLSTATVLGSLPKITLRDLTIHNEVDYDYFKITAQDTGKLIINAFFQDALGDIDLRVFDENGNEIASSVTFTDNEHIEIPVVSQEMYFLRVEGDDGDTNIYDLEIENFATPVPTGVHLDPNSDTGMMNNDGVTNDKTPKFFIQTDVLNFVDTNNNGTIGDDPINVLTAEEATAGETAGIAVEITLVNTTTGTSTSFFADPLIADTPEVYVFEPEDDLEAGVYLITARTKIFDLRENDDEEPDPAMGRSNASPPLWITLDCETPLGGTFELLAHSDSGMYDYDHVTNKMQPAFWGFGEPNSKVHVFAQRTDESGAPVTEFLPVGSGVVTDIGEGGFGYWEVTVEPLIDGKYNFVAVFEDAAGNVSDPVGLTAGVPKEVNMPIPNPGMVESTIEITEADFPGLVGDAADMIYQILDVNVLINIEHENDADIVVTLIAPDGLTEIVLTMNNGGDGDDYIDTLFDDSASTSITAGVAPFTGRFRPQQSLFALNGMSPFGEWTLRVEDTGGDFEGQFLNWALEIQVPLMLVIDTVAPNTPFLDLQSGPTVRSTIFMNDDTVAAIADVNVVISIDHPHVADLTVYLVSPEGTRVVLTANNGGDGANFTDTAFDDAAADSITSIVTADAPFTGVFSPQPGTSLADFNGQDPFGLWTLEVTDDFQPYMGQIVGWTLDIAGAAGLFHSTNTFDVSSDTGRHDHDNITKDNMPTVTMTSSDLNVGFSQLLWNDNFKFRIYDRYQDTAEFLLYDSALDAEVDEYLSADDMFTALTFITEVLPKQFYVDLGLTNAAVLDGGVLADGVHNLKLEVEDRAGNISHDFILEITVDTQVPPVSFGLPDAASEEDGLAADSDSGVVTMPMTYADRITNDTTPRLWGRAEADTIVQVFFDVNEDGVIDLDTDIFLGQTVAVPFDGNDAYPDGYWELVTALDLNEIDSVPLDGLRQLLVTAEDVAGNPMPMNDEIREGVDVLQIFIDTQGPQVNDVFIPGYEDYDLFDPKPSENGYTPLIFELTIEFIDQPERRAPDFLYEAVKEGIATSPGNYLLVGDHVGVIAIDEIFENYDSSVDGEPAITGIVLEFFEPLPDDRYTLTVSDNIVDPAGNHLDGESEFAEPQDDPEFPSGDGVPGGDFVARFTVDSRPEIGAYVSKSIQIDINGNFVWDPANAQIGNDATNVDLTFTLPVATGGAIGLGGFGVNDLLFAGRFRPEGAAAGNGRYFDQLAAYGYSADLGEFRFIIDTNSDGVVDTADGDVIVIQPTNIGFGFNALAAIPVAGNFDGVAANGDEIGLYYRGIWYLDTSNDGTYALDTLVFTNLLGQPIVGDFDGNGGDDLGVFNNNVFDFALNTGLGFDPFNFVPFTFELGFPGVLDKPVAADMDADGIDDIGLWVPRSSANPTGGAAEWYFWLSDFADDPLGHAFEPVPFGSDLFAVFGAERALPIVGNFDPPVSSSSSSSAAATSSSTTNDAATTSSSSESTGSTESSTPPASSLVETAESSTPPAESTASTKVVQTTTSPTNSTPATAQVTQEESQAATKSTATTTPPAETQNTSQSQQAPAKTVDAPAVSTSSDSDTQGGTGGTTVATVVVKQTAAPAPAETDQAPTNLGTGAATSQQATSVKVTKVVASAQSTPKPVENSKSTTTAKQVVVAPVVTKSGSKATATATDEQVNISTGAAASQQATSVKVTQAVASAQPKQKPLPDQATGNTGRQVPAKGTTAAKTVVVTPVVAKSGSKAAKSTTTIPAPAETAANSQVNHVTAVAVHTTPAAKPSPVTPTTPSVANVVVKSLSAPVSVASTAATAMVVSAPQALRMVPAAVSSLVVAEPPVAQFLSSVSSASLAMVQPLSDAVGQALGFFPTASIDASLSERIVTPLLATPLAGVTSLSADLLLQASSLQPLTLAELSDGAISIMGTLDFLAPDEELLEALESEQAGEDAPEEVALEVALQDWDAE